jgi:hypothetical protein
MQILVSTLVKNQDLYGLPLPNRFFLLQVLLLFLDEAHKK